MALASTTIWEANASASASMVNGGGFNTANANFLTDLTTDTNTGNTSSPVVSSASYNFVAGDVGHWVYISAGTNWTKGFYKIASVASNKATLQANTSEAEQLNVATNYYQPNTVVGCATVGTPTSGTFGIDYSRSTSALTTQTDFAAVGASTTLTSASAPFTRMMVGNMYHQNTTGTGGFGTVGWYEIVNYTNTTTVVLDRSPNGGTASVACTGRVGGALSFNSTLDDDWSEVMIAGNRVFFKNGSFTLGESISQAIDGSITNQNYWIGYNTIRGDDPTTAATMPAINFAGQTWALGDYTRVKCLAFKGSGSTMVTVSPQNRYVNCKATNISTSTNRDAFTIGSNSSMALCEAISYNGYAVNVTGSSGHEVTYSWLHASSIGYRNASGTSVYLILGNLITDNINNGIIFSGVITNPLNINGNTLYGAENTRGTGITFAAGTGRPVVLNNIITGFALGCTTDDGANNVTDNYNAYYNNDIDVHDLWYKGLQDVSTAPGFTNVAQVTGSTATYTGSTLTDSGKFANVVAGRDYIRLISGTGLTTAMFYGITAATANTVTTDLDAGESGAGNWTYELVTGNDFSIGTNYKALGTPGSFGGYTTGYMDIGAVQRQEAASGGQKSYTYG